MPTLPDSAKAQIYSAKFLPSAALGKETAGKDSLPSAFCRALGKEKHWANKKILEK